MPVKSFSATDVIGTVVIVNRYVSTVRPSEIDTGMPVSIRPNSSRKMISGVGNVRCPTANASSGSTTSAQPGSERHRHAVLRARHRARLRADVGAGCSFARPYGIDVDRR